MVLFGKLCLVFLGIARDILSVHCLRQFYEQEPVYSRAWTGNHEEGFTLTGLEALRTGFPAFDVIGNTEAALVVTRYRVLLSGREVADVSRR